MPTTMGPKRKKKDSPSIGIATSSGNGVNFTESAMDEFLSKQGLYRKPIAKDGSCLFRAVSEQVHNCQARHLDVRNQCIQFMRRNRMQFEEFIEGPFDHHLFNLQNPKEWAGQVEITALSKMFRKDFVVYQDINSPPTKVTDHGYKDKILLCYSNGNHYDIIYGNQYQEHAAMCQSLLFEMLYNKVFATLDKKESPKKSKVEVYSDPNNQKDIMDLVNGSIMEDREMMDNAGNDDGWTEVKSKARVKHEKHSKCNEIEEEKELPVNKSKGNSDQKNLWELRRSVDPHLYRNIPLEVWEEDKHAFQQKDMAVAASLQFKNGERCSVKLGPPTVANEKMFGAIIKEDYTGSGSILVYVQELNKRHTVPLQSVVGSHQSPGYKDLSGHYQKHSSLNFPVIEDDTKDDIKLKKKRPPRSRRNPGKGIDESGYVHEDAQPRGRGKPRNRHRFSGRKDDRSTKDMKDEEEARFIEEQIKLVELQEKDTTAFPALPARGCAQVPPSSVPSTAVFKKEKKIEMATSPAKEVKVPNTEKDTPPANNNTPAGIWSNFTKKKAEKPASEEDISLSIISIAKQEESEVGDILNTNVGSEAQQHDGHEINPESFRHDDFQEKEIDDDQLAILPDKETAHIDMPLQIKPVLDDISHGRTGPVFEVKITKSNLLKPLKLSPTSPKNQLEENEEGLRKHLQDFEENRMQKQLLEIDNIEESINRGNDKLGEEKSLPPSGNNNVEMSQMEVAVLEGSKVQQSNNFSLKKLCDGDQSALSLEEQNLMAPKQHDLNVLTQERKTVTFAEETKEIPDVPYSQSQKSILTMNGNRPEQGSKTITTDDYSSFSKNNSKQDYLMVCDNLEKDQQVFPSISTNDSMQSSSPTNQQEQLPSYRFYIPPNLPINLPPNVQLPTRPSMDATGADLPQDIPTLRHFFNLGYHTYYQMLTTANQLPFMYMYQAGAMQDPIMQQAGQPVVSLPQQQLYGSVHSQHAAFETHAIQSYNHFQVPPQTSHESVSPLDRTSERIIQQQVQPQAQIQMPHQQQSGHLQQQQNQMQWRNKNPGGTSRHFKMQHHNVAAQPHRPMTWSQGTGNQRQQHSNSNKQNRKPQSGKSRNDNYPQHFNNSHHVQSMGHNAAYYSAPGELQTKAHSSAEYCHVYHSTGPRGNNY